MKPLNLDNKPCSPISSNCVIWQGPDIPCIKLCTGDTVSDVVAKLATELCTVLDILNVTNYDLSCFNLVACPPNDFQALIQFLIDRICALQTEINTVADPATSPIVNTPKSASADTPVTVANCFIVNGVTVMTVSEYAIEIGKKVCSLVTEIATIQASITNLDLRVTALEVAPAPTFTVPSFTLDCSIDTLASGTTQFINVILESFINDVWCNYYYNVTGTSNDLSAAVNQICILDSDLQLTTGSAFSTNPLWIQSGSYSTVADAINNLWVALCDVYNYTRSYSITVNDTATINLDNTANVITANLTDSGWVDLDGFTYYSGVAKPKCRRIGNQIHFKGTVIVPLENPFSPGAVVPLTSLSTYNSVTGCTTWSGVGGCSINANGAISFNNGGSVVPGSITAQNFDDSYVSDWDIATRPIDVDATYGTCLTSAVRVFITSTKGLTLQLVHDLEITTTRGAGVQGNSPLRLITSNVRSGEYLPNYIGTGTDIHNAPSNANFPLVSDTFNLTWPFSCDAGNENQVGGFQFKLDGLIAYLEPCNTETGFSTVCP
jgi:hypothetical protein